MSILLLLRPELGVDVPFYAGLDFGAGFVDLSSSLTAFTLRRGRQVNLERVEAATANVRFKNGNGDLDPANPGSPYAPNVLPNKPLRLFRHQAGVTYQRFNGYVERYRPEWAPPKFQFLATEAADVFERLANIALGSGAASLETALAGANNDLVFTARDEGPTGQQITVTYVVAGTNTPLSAATNEPIEGARVEASVRDDRLLGLFRSGLGAFRAPSPVTPTTVTVQGTDITVQVATNGAGAATSTASQIKTALEASTDVMKLVSVALAPGNSGAGVVTALAKSSLAGGTWPQELSGARIGRILDLIGYTGPRAIDTGVSEIVEGGFSLRENKSALAHIQDVADSELGYVFVAGDGTFTYHDGAHRSTSARSTTSQATFSDDGTGIAYRELLISSVEKDRVANYVTVTGGAQGAEPQLAEDTASQDPDTGYGTRSLARQTLLADDADALAQAQAIVAAYANPVTRFDSITVRDDGLPGNGSDAWSQAVLGREIGDLITIRTTPPVQDGATPYTIAYDCFIEAIEDTATAGAPWHVTFKVSLASQSVGAPPDPPGGGAALKDSSGDDFVLDSGTAGILG